MNARVMHIQGEADASQRARWPKIDYGRLSSGGGHQTISEREIWEVVAIEDRFLRNLRITLGYHDLLLDMAELLGERNVTWPAFACWASRTAGSFIRGEYIPDSVQRYLDSLKWVHTALHAVHRLLLGMRREAPPPSSLLGDIVQRVSDEITVNVSWGNHMVFEDIAPLYARLRETVGNGLTYDQQALDRFTSRLKPGPVEQDGQGLLIDAFTSYYRAIFETDVKKKAELILLGNNQVGLHEQTRLQPTIDKSLDAPIADIIAKTARTRARELTHRRMHGFVDQQIDRVLEPLSRKMQNEWRSIATGWFMHLQLPDRNYPDRLVIDRIQVGVDVPRRSKRSAFPPQLTRLHNIELKALLYDLDKSPNTIEGTRVENWAALDDRMDYLVDLFRTRQQDKLLYRQPFSDEQIRDLRRNEIPSGAL